MKTNFFSNNTIKVVYTCEKIREYILTFQDKLLEFKNKGRKSF